MTKSPSMVVKTLLALAVAGSMAAFIAQPAAAQTAKKLKCTGCIKSKQLRNGQVKGIDLSSNSVSSAKIIDGGVGSADLAGDSVNSAKIQNGAVGNADLANDAVNSSKVQNNSLTANDLGPNSVGQSEIATNGVGASEIVSNAVGSSEVQGNSIPATDMSNEAGADFAGGNQSVNLTPTDTTIRSVTISAPSGGKVIVNASGFFDLNSAGNDAARCSITTGTTIDQNALIIYNDVGAVGHTGLVPFAATRGFNVGAGATVFRLVCDEFVGITSVNDTNLTAMYFPTTY